MPFPVIEQAKAEAILAAQQVNNSLGAEIRTEILASVTAINGILATIQDNLVIANSRITVNEALLITHTSQIASLVIALSLVSNRVSTLESDIILKASLSYVDPILVSLQSQIDALTP